MLSAWVEGEAVAMSKVFYELSEAASLLGISVEELEEMVSTAELRMVTVGERRRLVYIEEVDALVARVEAGGRLRTRTEFRAQNLSTAIKQAATRLGVDRESLVYEVMEGNAPWMLGRGAKQTRIVVDLPEGDAGDRKEDSAPEVKTVPNKPTSGKSEGAKDQGTYYYAPEQAARLLGKDRHEINLAIYLKKLPVVSINDYRWIPKDKVDEWLAREPNPSAPEDPPRPFLIVADETDKADDGSHLGSREIIPGEPAVPADLLRQRIEELEREIRTLRLGSTTGTPDSQDEGFAVSVSRES